MDRRNIAVFLTSESGGHGVQVPGGGPVDLDQVGAAVDQQHDLLLRVVDVCGSTAREGISLWLNGRGSASKGKCSSPS